MMEQMAQLTDSHLGLGSVKWILMQELLLLLQSQLMRQIQIQRKGKRFENQVQQPIGHYLHLTTTIVK